MLVADIELAEELVANPKKPAVADVLEAHLDQGRGPVVSALVEEGTLRVGDTIVAGRRVGPCARDVRRVAARPVTEAGPSVPVEVLGLADVPMAGDEVRVAPNDKVARTVAEARAHRRKAAALRNPMMLAGGARLEDVFAAVQRGEVATLNLIVKADSQGSLEAITDALRKLDQEHDEVRLSFVHRGVGGITESDADLAVVSNASVIGFNVRPDRKARELAEQENVEMRLYEVIYNVLEDVNNALVGMLKPEYEEVVTGEAEVREVFGVPRIGKVAGCLRHQRRHHPRLEGAFPPRRHGHLEGRDRIAAALQGRRARGPRGLRVRYRARELLRPEAGRHHRDVRGARDRPSLRSPDCASCATGSRSSCSSSRSSGAVARPWRLPAWVAPIGAAAIALLARRRRRSHDGARDVRPLAAPLAFVALAVPLAVMLDEVGVFEELAGRGRAQPAGRRRVLDPRGRGGRVAEPRRGGRAAHAALRPHRARASASIR